MHRFRYRYTGLLAVTAFLVSTMLICGCGTPGPVTPSVSVKPGPLVTRKTTKTSLNLPRVKIRPNKWKYVVVHHSATPAGSAAAFEEFHRNKKGWNRGLGYHFVIGNGNGARNGLVETGHRWTGQIDGAHAGSKEYNQHGIGVCLVGDFEGGSPTTKQISSLVSLVTELQQLCNIPPENVILHRHVRDTQCPGDGFPYYELLANLPR